MTAALAQAGRGERLLDGLPIVRRACPLDQSRSWCGSCMGACLEQKMASRLAETAGNWCIAENGVGTC